MAPPLIAVVPVTEFCTRLVASTVEPMVVVPVLVKEMASNAKPVLPTAPMKLIAPVPALTVRSFAVALALLTVLPN